MSCTATIKWFNSKKGYGFAAPETGGDDIFVHIANIVRDADGNAPYLDEDQKIFCAQSRDNCGRAHVRWPYDPDRFVRSRALQITWASTMGGRLPWK